MRFVAPTKVAERSARGHNGQRPLMSLPMTQSVVSQSTGEKACRFHY